MHRFQNLRFIFSIPETFQWKMCTRRCSTQNGRLDAGTTQTGGLARAGRGPGRGARRRGRGAGGCGVGVLLLLLCLLPPLLRKAVASLRTVLPAPARERAAACVRAAAVCCLLFAAAFCVLRACWNVLCAAATALPRTFMSDWQLIDKWHNFLLYRHQL